MASNEAIKRRLQGIPRGGLQGGKFNEINPNKPNPLNKRGVKWGGRRKARQQMPMFRGVKWGG